MANTNIMTDYTYILVILKIDALRLHFGALSEQH